MNLKSHAIKITATLAAALPLAFAAGTACAETGPAGQGGPAGPAGLAFAQQKNCMSCHSMTHASLMGPAFRDIASRYASKPDAQSYLAHKILEGSSGTWGNVPMPANTQLSPGQAAMLAGWILTLK
jgi:cytochrome c